MSFFDSFAFAPSRRGTKAKRKRFQLEALEPRVVLTSNVEITEFQASNINTLFDEDEDSSDWIELQNTSLETVNLSGWFLTDDPANLTKWSFPNVELSSDEFMVVFASGKDRKDLAISDELHTNFKLRRAGEYLALVEQDGVTLASEFAPFPPQLEGQSYGLAIGRDTVTFVDDNAAVTAFVPTDDSLGTAWTGIGFDDAGWQSGTTAVGFEQLLPGFGERDDFDAPLGPDWTVEIPDGGTSTLEVSGGSLNVTVPGQQNTGEERGLAPYFLREAPQLNSDYEIITHVTIETGMGGGGIVIEDGLTGLPAMNLRFSRTSIFSQVQINTGDTPIISNFQFDTTSIFLRFSRGLFEDSWTASFKKNAGDDWTELASVTEGLGDVPQISAPRIGLFAHTSSDESTRVHFDFYELNVFDERPVYAPLTGLDVEADMAGSNSSVYIRIPFDVTNAERFDEMDMGLNYDDGYIAYLNGVEIDRRNVPVVSTWDSAASGRFGAVDGQIPLDDLSLNAFTDQLVDGENILAFHGMNVAADDADFFLTATMSAAEILSTTTQAFVTPSPGVDNLLPAAPTPIISEPGGAFMGTKVVEITNPEPSPNLRIRYTLDGSIPTESSPLYTGPLMVSSSVWLRARVFDDDVNPSFSPGFTASESYIAIHSQLATRDSDLPILVIDTLGQSFPFSSSSTFAGSTVALFDTDPLTGRTRISDGNVDYAGFGGFRRRGSSTAGTPKPSLAFETWGDSDDDVDVSLLGLPAKSDWVLYAPFHFDRTLIREQFIFELSNAIGGYAARTRTIEVYANVDGGVVDEEDYHGVYVLMEKLKQGNDRIDVADADFEATYDSNVSVFEQPDPAITGGYVWKIDRSDPGEQSFSAGGYSINWVYPKPQGFVGNAPSVTDDQQAYVTDYINEFWEVLQSPDAYDPVNGYAKYIDVDAWIDHHLLNVVSMNVDAQRLSAYFHKDANGKLAFGPIWDFDRSMDSTDIRDDNPLEWRGRGNDCGTDFFGTDRRPLCLGGNDMGGRWWRQLFQDPNFFQKYVDHYHELRQTEFSDAAIDARIDKFADIVRESRARDLARWNQTPRSASACFGGCDGTWEGEVENMRNWLHTRLQFMDDTLPFTANVFLNGEELPVTPLGVAVESGAVVAATAPAGLPEIIDEVLLSGEPGSVNVRYFVPGDNDLGTSWTDPSFNDANWSTGTNGVGYERIPADYEALIATSVKPQNVVVGATTIMTRTPFDVDPANVSDFVLQMKFDDGFVAYLNGTEVARKNVEGTLNWNSAAADSNADINASSFEDFDITAHKDLLVNGTNMLAIQVVNRADDSDQLVLPQFVSRQAIVPPDSPRGTLYYTTDGSDPRGTDGQPSATALELPEDGSIVIAENTQVIIRNLDATDHRIESEIVTTDWGAPIKHNFIVDPGGDLAITEINYNPVGPTDQEQAAIREHITDSVFEFVEVQNVGTSPLDLDGVRISNGVEFDFSSSPFESLAPGQRVVVVADQAGFERRYGAGLPIAGEFEGNLDNRGERVTLVDGLDNVLFTTSYSDASYWPQAADGVGATLELINPAGTTPLTSGKFYSWRSSREVGGTPGTAGAGPVGIVINEVLANTDASPLVSDSIELFNTTAASLNIGGWFLSDGTGTPNEFVIPAGTSIPGGGYLVFDETDFNFALSGTDGDDVWLTVDPDFDPDSDDDPVLQWIVDDVHFGGAASLESFGRVPDGSGHLAPLKASMLGLANGEPRVGPLVISEVQYNPGEPTPEASALYPPLNGGDLEYIEIHNPTADEVDLTNWRIRGGVDLNFDDGTTLAAGETVVMVSFNPDRADNVARVAAFHEFYGIDDSVRLLGGYEGQLNNGGDRVELQRAVLPIPSQPLVVAHVIEDEVLFDDLAPWPAAVDGAGASLQRMAADAYGNAATSWIASGTSVGTANFGSPIAGDVNGDGSVNAADIDTLYVAINANDMDSIYDLDASGRVDEDDVRRLFEILNIMRGDANLDGIVDPQDLNALGQNWLANGNVSWADGDFNGDLKVDPLDLNSIGQNWLQGRSPARSPRAPLAAVAAVAPDVVDRALDEFNGHGRSPRFVSLAADPIDPADWLAKRGRRPVHELAQTRRRLSRGETHPSQMDGLGEADDQWRGHDDLFAELF